VKVRIKRTLMLVAAVVLVTACASDTTDGADAQTPPEDPVPIELYETVSGDVERADEVTAGEGWDLLDSRAVTTRFYGAKLARDADDLARTWDQLLLDGDPPDADHREQLVVVVPAPGECEIVLRDVQLGETYEDDLGGDVAVMRIEAQTPATCDERDETGRTFTIAADRAYFQAQRIDVRIGDAGAAIEDRSASDPGA
jgi:hypothetical protein